MDLRSICTQAMTAIAHAANAPRALFSRVATPCYLDGLATQAPSMNASMNMWNVHICMNMWIYTAWILACAMYIYVRRKCKDCSTAFNSKKLGAFARVPCWARQMRVCMYMMLLWCLSAVLGKANASVHVYKYLRATHTSKRCHATNAA